MACECTEKRRLEHLEHAVYGNGRNSLRADIDMNTKRLTDIETGMRERRAQTWALVVVIVAQVATILIAAFK